MRWLRQEPIGPYIVDFYCSVARLVVEFDGDAHGFTRAEDAERETWLQAQGIRIVRFPNWVVLHQPDAVLEHLFEFWRRHLDDNSPANG